MVNVGDLGEMGFGAGLEVCRAAVVEARVLEFIQCSNLALCCGKAYLLFGFVIQPRDFVPAAYYCDIFSVTWPIQTPLAAMGPP
jgi:hypothetical protein